MALPFTRVVQKNARLLQPMRQYAYSAQECLASFPKSTITLLPNGMRVATEATDSGAATVGVYIDSGTRNESAATQGAAHFLEHVTFKSQPNLEKEIESMGGLLNASTTRELASFSAQVAKEDATKALGLIVDAVKNTTFTNAVVEQQRDVILKELDQSDGCPETVVMDYLHSVAYQGTNLAKSVLGSTKTIQSVDADTLNQYVTENYSNDRIVVVGAGGVDHDQLVELVKNNFKGLPDTAPETGDLCVSRFTGSEVRVHDDDMPWAYAAVAFETPGATSSSYFPMLIGAEMVGSWNALSSGGKNSTSPLVNILTKEKVAQSYKCFTTTYSDTGLFGAYLVLPRTSADDGLFEVQSEWIRLCVNASDNEINRAKLRLKTRLLKNLDDTADTCDSIGQQVVSTGRRLSPLEISTRLDACSPQQIRDVMTEILYDRCPAVAGYGAIEGLTDYNRIRGSQHWL
eukprot:Awhi_evm1s26